MATKSVQVDTGAVAQLGMDGVEQVTAPNLVLTDLPRPNLNSPQDPPHPNLLNTDSCPCPVCCMRVCSRDTAGPS